MTDHVITYPENREPDRFTAAELGWLPWLNPVAEDDLTDRHWDGLVDRSRAKSDYFRFLAHDPDILGSRTRTDKDIFYNPKGGLPRAERELAAAAVSRVNGCIFCASVHARFAIHHYKRDHEVAVLLDEGLPTPLTGRAGAVVRTAAALSASPIAVDSQTIQELASAGLEEEEIVDLVLASAFFNWANRLMLSLGEPAAAAT
jgi:alkylhydroperoxidase domain protein